MKRTRKNVVDWDAAFGAFGTLRHLRHKNTNMLVRQVRDAHARKLARAAGRSPRQR